MRPSIITSGACRGRVRLLEGEKAVPAFRWRRPYHVRQGALEHGGYVRLRLVDLGAQTKVSNLRRDRAVHIGEGGRPWGRLSRLSWKCRLRVLCPHYNKKTKLPNKTDCAAGAVILIQNTAGNGTEIWGCQAKAKSVSHLANEPLALHSGGLEHDVARLEVRMQYARRVHVHHGLGDIKGCLNDGGDTQAAA